MSEVYTDTLTDNTTGVTEELPPAEFGSREEAQEAADAQAAFESLVTGDDIEAGEVREVEDDDDPIVDSFIG